MQFVAEERRLFYLPQAQHSKKALFICFCAFLRRCITHVSRVRKEKKGVDDGCSYAFSNPSSSLNGDASFGVSAPLF